MYSSYRKAIFLICFLTIQSLGMDIEAQETKALKPQYKIAFLPDIHFHDVFGDLHGEGFEGIPVKGSKQNASIRSMSAQLNSTRLFNENYFAFIATLNDIVAKNIRVVALPGDFSDDGQPMNLNGLKKILQHYQKTHGLQFFITNGNHDPVRPDDTQGGKPDFLSSSGKEIAIYSKASQQCSEQQNKQTPASLKDLSLVCSDKLLQAGYQRIADALNEFGFFPRKNYLYWESPYSLNTLAYNFNQERQNAELKHRQFRICTPAKTSLDAENQQKSYCRNMPDTSYVVEPVPGLWLLAIDANVYIPLDENRTAGSGNAGYNAVLKYKPFLIEWISGIVKRAKTQNKTLIAFSHYPMTDFYENQADRMRALFGENSNQLGRLPHKNTAMALADLGLKVHVGGHMHMNDTGVIRSEKGNYLFNIQAPSIAAYIPAYKLMTIYNKQKIEVKTVQLGKVQGFNRFFPPIKKNMTTYEQAQVISFGIRLSSHQKIITNIPTGTCENSLDDVFFPREWPASLKKSLLNCNGLQLLVASQISTNKHKVNSPNDFNCQLSKETKEWEVSLSKLRPLLAQSKIKLEDFEKWQGLDLGIDYYRIRNAGSLARRDINAKKLQQYQILNKAWHERLKKNAANTKKTSLNHSGK